MDLIYASRGNWIYAIDIEKGRYWCESSINALKKRMTWATANRLGTFNEFHEFTIRIGPYRNRNLLKHITLVYPEWLI